MKKLKSLVCAVALFVTFHTTNGQNIEQEITSFVDTTEILVNNGRRMLLHYVQANNFERVAEISQFLTERTYTYNCAAFTINEELHIAALTNNWVEFFTIAQTLVERRNINLCAPIHDQLLTTTLQSTVESRIPQLLANAQAANLTFEEEQLLQLYFHLYEFGVDEAYRQKLRAFRRQHPQSRFDGFVRHYLPDAPARMAMGFNMGVVRVSPTGGLSHYFSPATGFNFGVDFVFDRFVIGIQGDIAGMRLNAPLLGSATGYRYDIFAGSRLLYENIGLALGYTVLRNNRLEITPFMSIGATGIFTNIYGNPDRNRNREFAVTNSFTFGPGVRTELQLARFMWTDPFMPWRGQMPSSINLRLEVGYNMPTRFNYSPAQGNIFYARAGLVWWMGNM